MSASEKHEIALIPEGILPSMGEFYLSLSEEDKQFLCNTDPDAREMQLTILQMAYSNKDEGDVARDIARDIHESIIETASTVPVQETLFQYFPMPTEITRTSPFFIMSTREMGKKRERIENLEIARHGWGYITFSGLKLSISDEDTLMVLLDVLNDCNNRRETEFGGKKTYMYQGPLLPLLKKKDPKTKRPGKAQYKAFHESLERLAEARFRLVTNRKNIQGNPAPRSTLISGIVTGLNIDPETGIYTIVLNPWFYEMFCEGAVTYLELNARLDLSSQYAKALYRFITSHRDDEWRSHISTIMVAINVDEASQPLKKIRQNLGIAIKEMIARGHLTAKSGLLPKNFVYLQRTPSKRAIGGKGSPKKITGIHNS